MTHNSYILNAAIPSYWGWTAYTPVIPKLYWDVYSQEERIKRLCKEYDKLTHYVSFLAKEINALSEELDDRITAIEESVSEQLAEQNALVEAELAKMRLYIDEKLSEYAQGTQVWDVTTGTYRPSKQAMRRLFQALSYSNTGSRQLVSEVAKLKTSKLAEQTVYYTAYSDRPNVTLDDQLGAESIYKEN